MDFWTRQIGFIVTLVAILDPFMAVPFFLSMSAHRPEAERRRIARVASLTVFAILAGSALSGEALLLFLGASLSSFRLAGGLVLLLMALAMLQAHPGDVRQTEEEASAFSSPADTANHEPTGIVPLAIPLLAGPGAISTVMIAVQHGGWKNQMTIMGDIAFVCLLLWLMLRLAIPLGHRLGRSGFNVATRLLGLLLAAIAMESMADGLKQLFPVLGSRQ